MVSPARSNWIFAVNRIVSRTIESGEKGDLNMGREDVAAGKVKQIKGNANDVIGAVRGDTAQQIKGKVQKAVGKVQEKLGKTDRADRSRR
jgi:uncharacterized protein YjbJ (UPF0337 family)